MTLCITVDLEYLISYAFEAIHCHSVGLLIFAWIAVGTRKWSSVLIGGDYNYAHACLSRFMHVLHVGGCGLDMPKGSSHGCHARVLPTPLDQDGTPG